MVAASSTQQKQPLPDCPLSWIEVRNPTILGHNPKNEQCEKKVYQVHALIETLITAIQSRQDPECPLCREKVIWIALDPSKIYKPYKEENYELNNLDLKPYVDAIFKKFIDREYHSASGKKIIREYDENNEVTKSFVWINDKEELIEEDRGPLSIADINKIIEKMDQDPAAVKQGDPSYMKAIVNLGICILFAGCTFKLLATTWKCIEHILDIGGEEGIGIIPSSSISKSRISRIGSTFEI